MKFLQIIAAAALLAHLFVPCAVAGENCAMLGGTCKDACGRNEAAEGGAFDDCGEKQDCCVSRAAEETQCCVLSFEQKNYGLLNCTAPELGKCAKGSASAVPCTKLIFCK